MRAAQAAELCCGEPVVSFGITWEGKVQKRTVFLVGVPGSETSPETEVASVELELIEERWELREERFDCECELMRLPSSSEWSESSLIVLKELDDFVKAGAESAVRAAR